MNFYRSCFVLSLFFSCAANADTLDIYPDRDATLIEHPHGELANGAGPALFVGRTSQSANALRRTLLHFDVAGALPEKAIIENVSLTLHMTRGNPSPVNMNLHRVLDDWHEGPSSSAGGGGAVAQPGDATWLHTNYDVEYWKRVGGFYVPRASAMTVVSGSAFYTWQHNPHMLADVRRWLRTPHRNFGWMLLGDENTSQSVKRFDSRETTTDEYRPVLTINYRLPGNHKCRKEKE